MDVEMIIWRHPETGLVYTAEEKGSYQRRTEIPRVLTDQPNEYILWVPSSWCEKDLYGTYSSLEVAKATAEYHHSLYGAHIYKERQKEEQKAKQRTIALLKQDLFKLENG